MAQPIAVVENVSRVYHVGREDVYAVREANWQIEPGRFIALQGRSGSGKTTLLNLVGGLDRPTAGMVRIME
ncbi:MAG: ATP-binding cassette domain-containing protein, partial [Chloroflexota bacterium]|nr:ATP-binding cassette domain-containing protein [Chloroflexota bacterium]